MCALVFLYTEYSGQKRLCALKFIFFCVKRSYIHNNYDIHLNLLGKWFLWLIIDLTVIT